MTIVTNKYPEKAVLVLTSTDDLLTAGVIQEMRDSIVSSAAKHVIIDLGAVRYLVSASLYPHAEPIAPLINLHRQLLAEARRLVLCNLRNDVAELFRITRLDQFFEVQPDLETAMSNAVGEGAR